MTKEEFERLMNAPKEEIIRRHYSKCSREGLYRLYRTALLVGFLKDNKKLIEIALKGFEVLRSLREEKNGTKGNSEFSEGEGSINH